MSGFLVVRTKAHNVVADQAQPVLTAQSGGILRRLQWPGCEVWVAGTAAHAPLVIEEPGSERALVVHGMLLYAGAVGQRAACRLLADLALGLPDDAALGGNFALVWRDGNQVSLATDRVGLCPLYAAGSGCWSTSLLAVAKATGATAIARDPALQYVVHGAAHALDMPIVGVSRIDPDQVVSLAGSVVQRRDVAAQTPVSGSLAVDHLERIHAVLEATFKPIVAEFGDRVGTALSGGYDSRLMLAHLRAAGCQPQVHVYGAADNPDVVAARRIAAGEGFTLQNTDKANDPALASMTPETVLARTLEGLMIFDGLPNEGLFGIHRDLLTRMQRREEGEVALNGGGGEVLRDFFYLRDRSWHSKQIVQCFYARRDPRMFRDPGLVNTLDMGMAQSMQAAIGADSELLSRAEVDAVYARFRCRYWMAPNAAVNCRLGLALTPLVDWPVVAAACNVPVQHRWCGDFEAALIRRADLALASYPSDYGHNFLTDANMQRRLAAALHRWRPVALRPLPYRLRLQRQKPLPLPGTAELRQVLLGSGEGVTAAWLHVDRMRDGAHLNRALTVDVLARWLAGDLAGTA